MISAIILAAGRGSRMQSSLPKVLQPLSGKPLLAHVLDCAKQVSDEVHIICGYKQDLVKQSFADEVINWVYQAQQLGTAHAVMQASPNISTGIAVILYGDVPLINPKTLQQLCKQAQKSQAALLSVELADPVGYGRIIRNQDKQISQIIEQKDCDEQTLKITEVNTGIMAIQVELLHQYLPKITANNAQGELYLTDIVGLMSADNLYFSSVICQDANEVIGVNDKIQLADLERQYQIKQATAFMQAGLTMLDPYRFDCRGELSFGTDCQIDINVIFQGKVVLGNKVKIEANCIIKDSTIGDDSIIYANSMIENSSIANKVQIGPFARLRPQTTLADYSKIGNFVEVKKSTIGKHSKINHLSYIGDATIGQSVNVGAGVITCNYDGVNKYPTHIQDGAFIGSDSQLVAPVSIGKNATIGAGSTIIKDAPDEQLSLSRAEQLSLKNWQKPNKR